MLELFDAHECVVFFSIQDLMGKCGDGDGEDGEGGVGDDNDDGGDGDGDGVPFISTPLIMFT